MVKLRRMSSYDVDGRLERNPYTSRIIAIASRKDLNFESIDLEFGKVGKSAQLRADSILGGGKHTESTGSCRMRFNPSACDADKDLNTLQQCHEARELLNLASCDSAETFYLRMGAVMQGVNPSFGGPTMVASLRRQQEAAMDAPNKERINIGIDHGV